MSRGTRKQPGTPPPAPAPPGESGRDRLERDLARRRRERRRREADAAPEAAPGRRRRSRAATGTGHDAHDIAAANRDASRTRASATAPRPARRERTRRAPVAPDPALLRQRQRRRRLLVARLRAVGVVLLLAGLVVAWIAVPKAGVFRIRQVSVVGTSAVSDLLVRNRVQRLLDGQTIYTVDRGAVARAVNDLPFVRSVQVRRHFPSGIEIVVHEYSPLALGMTDTGQYLVARDGRVLTKAQIGDWLNRIPLVRIRHRHVKVGDHIGDEPALRLLRVAPPDFPGTFTSIEVVELRDPIAGAAKDVEPEYDITAKVTDGPEIRVGREADLQQKLLVAGRLLTMFGGQRRENIRYIDVTVPARPAVGFAPGGQP